MNFPLNFIYVVEDPESYGLHVESSFWLEPDRTISSYSLPTETACELKPKPWKIRVKFGDAIFDIEVSPNSDCAQVLSRLTGKIVGG